MLSKPNQRSNQRGAVLVVGLIFLAMLTLMGVAAYSVATQEEKMAGNSRDRLRASRGILRRRTRRAEESGLQTSFCGDRGCWRALWLLIGSGASPGWPH